MGEIYFCSCGPNLKMIGPKTEEMCLICPNAMFGTPGARRLRPEKGVYSIGLDLVFLAVRILLVTDESADEH